MAESKVSKASVDYGPGHPGGDHCGVCRHFEPPDACEVVRGLIHRRDWCKRFVADSARKRYQVAA